MKILLVLVVFFSSTLFAEMGSGYLSVVRVELNNGEKFEAVMVIATAEGRDSRYYDQNGFLLILKERHIKNPERYVESYKNGHLFGTDIYRVEFYRGKRPIRNYTSNVELLVNRDRHKTYYLRGQSSAHHSGNSNRRKVSNIDTTGSSIRLNKRIHIEQNYIIEDSIDFYPELPEDYNYRTGIPIGEAKRIGVYELRSLELVKRPSQEWLDKISTIQEIWWKKVEDQGCPPVGAKWFHYHFDKSGNLSKEEPLSFRRYKEY